MPTWKDFEEEHRKQERTRRQESQREYGSGSQSQSVRREQEEINQVLRRREESNSSNWGTPERAIATWESRSKKLVDIANELRNQFTSKLNDYVLRNGYSGFDIYGPNDTFLGFLDKKKILSTFKISELTVKEQENRTGNYVALLRGNSVYPQETFYFKNEEIKKYQNPKSLEDFIKKWLKYGAFKDSIDKRTARLFDAVKEYFSYKEFFVDRDMEISHSCEYVEPTPKKVRLTGYPPELGFSIDSTQDLYTDLTFNSDRISHGVRILNPVHSKNEKFQDYAFENIMMATEYSSSSGQNPGWDGRRNSW